MDAVMEAARDFIEGEACRVVGAVYTGDTSAIALVAAPEGHYALQLIQQGGRWQVTDELDAEDYYNAVA